LTLKKTLSPSTASTFSFLLDNTEFRPHVKHSPLTCIDCADSCWWMPPN